MREGWVFHHVASTGYGLWRFFVVVGSDTPDARPRVFWSDSYRSQKLAAASAERYVREHLEELPQISQRWA